MHIGFKIIQWRDDGFSPLKIVYFANIPKYYEGKNNAKLIQLDVDCESFFRKSETSSSSL